MVLVFGGAYQGKLDYVYENYGKSLSLFQCSVENTDIDFTKDVLNSFHMFVLAHIKNKTDALGYITGNLEAFSNKIIICDDISNGVVPIEKETRLWRETVGRCMTLLSNNSDEVIRVLCGLGMKIK